MTLQHRQLGHLLAVWRWKRRLEVPLSPATGFHCKTFSSTPSDPDPIEIHKKKLFLWFSHLPKEEKQFGGYFTPETMHVHPLIMERKAEEKAGLVRSPYQRLTQSDLPVTVEQLFELTDTRSVGRGRNVLMYGAVGTGKSTVFRKLVLDWCSGNTLNRFKLLLPFSCEDLSQISSVASLRNLVGRKYLHLRQHPLLSGEGDQAKDVLFLFNGLEKMRLDFRIGASELCSNPNEPLPAAVIVVNLLRKYLLPEASILVSTRLSALDRIPQKYVSHYIQICGFNHPDLQHAYFTSRLLLQRDDAEQNQEAQELIEGLYSNLQRESQLAAACFLPSYCWLTCATLHFLRFTDSQAPIRTLTGIYTSFLRLNFGGEVLSTEAGPSVPDQERHPSLMMYVVLTVGKLAYDGVMNKRTSFSERELEQWIGGTTKTDEELHHLAMFQTDVLSFFLVPCVESKKRLSKEPSEYEERQYVFAAPAMQEYLAALYVVLGENKSALEKLSRQVSLAIGQVGEDVSAFFSILSKFLPLRIFAVFNLLKLFPKMHEKISSYNKGKIGRIMAVEMFRPEDDANEDVLNQVEQSLVGVHGPQERQYENKKPFELYPIFMGGLLHYGNRVLLQQLDCNIESTTVAQITRTLKKLLVRALSKPMAPEEMMDLLLFLYEFQNPRLTEDVLSSVKSICLEDVYMTSLKCFILSSVLSCTTTSYHLRELDLSSCFLTQDMIRMLWPAFKHTHSLKLGDNPKLNLDSACSTLLEGLPKDQSLKYLDLMHTGLGDRGALELADKLQQFLGLQEVVVSYNNIGDDAALTLVDACREHPTIHTVHLYLNPISDVAKQSSYIRGVSKSGGSQQRVRVLASVTDGSDISEDWDDILSLIREKFKSWDHKRVKQQLEIFLKDLERGRQQQQSFFKRLHFSRVHKKVKKTLQMLEKDIIQSSR